MVPSWILLFGLSLIAPTLADECQPETWRMAALSSSGSINCRMSEVSGAKVDPKTCATLAKKWDISVEKFYELNPRLEDSCENVRPKIRYCVDGFVEPLRAYDGMCGPQNKNATCVGTDKQCCNKKTWTCGDSEEDCTVNCYEGNCY
ncbi:uncharacterized protein FIESC28_02469 [Fusarium coffeatum]|uniref:LysM domain-containing protein n=1 Tax=Fusarium coffeatum TaxID=231269 RepID=A0A366S7P5_9HYPO|nr:uncharacterized protein FIESC28_02469 [Fusarium coffeatum]RBR24696.1 hypothetical protein FIESC28_02469 [Fusarium coffeatum]